MAHFAKIENGIVTQVIVVNNDAIEGGDFPAKEPLGQEFCTGLLGGVWKQTSYNGNFRGRYAGVGYAYDEELDAFISPKPYASWTLNEETTDWEAPVARPAEGMWVWNEDEQRWDEFVQGE